MYAAPLTASSHAAGSRCAPDRRCIASSKRPSPRETGEKEAPAADAAHGRAAPCAAHPDDAAPRWSSSGRLPPCGGATPEDAQPPTSSGASSPWPTEPHGWPARLHRAPATINDVSYQSSHSAAYFVVRTLRPERYCLSISAAAASDSASAS
ncbi:hypothetical protein GQ600_13036 [Phytophthora cactorum]|nr:hypothetical protein GQ600_13036 [Phytophthora cactorum]